MKIQLKIEIKYDTINYANNKSYHSRFIFDNKYETKITFIHNKLEQVALSVGGLFQKIPYNSFPKILRTLHKTSRKCILKIYNEFCPNTATFNTIVLNYTAKKTITSENWK